MLKSNLSRWSGDDNIISLVPFGHGIGASAGLNNGKRQQAAWSGPLDGWSWRQVRGKIGWWGDISQNTEEDKGANKGDEGYTLILDYIQQKEEIIIEGLWTDV